MLLWQVLLLVGASLCLGTNVPSRLVELGQGPVRGYQDEESGVFVFSSIPYATAPTGSQRFQGPLPPPRWTEPLEVNKNIVCHQVDNMFMKDKLMQEDCLIANVYVPETEKTNLPVVVYIHGGGFEIGFGDMIPPTNFIKGKQLVAVTFNYRLGINGFLCLGTEGAPGNAGLKDQVALLRWVNENIAAFGGNPDDVTIVGGSAGSISVDFLVISKLANGLFHKAIPESGISTGYISIQMNPIEMTKDYAKSLGFTNVDDIFAMEQFLKNVPVEEFYKSGGNFINESISLSFVPCVERRLGNNEVFIDDAPVNIIKNGDYRKVPMLLGYATMEGFIFIGTISEWIKKMNNKFSDVLPSDLKFDNDHEKAEVAETVKQFYFGDKEITEDSVLPFVDYFTDILFAYPTVNSVKLYVDSGHNEIYLYEYSFTDENSPVLPGTNVRVANHCAQTITVLDGLQQLSPIEIKYSEEYVNIRTTVQAMWYNFIQTGRPVPPGSSLPEWPATGPDGSPYMLLETDVRLGSSLLGRRRQLWDDVYSKHYRLPSAPMPITVHSEL